MKILAGDVGGTNARLATITVTGARARIETHKRYPSRDYPGLAPIVKQFCTETGQRPERACYAVACPVVGERCSTPNLPWTLDAKELAGATGIAHTVLLNDFAAVGHAIPLLGPDDLVTLQEGRAEAHGPRAVIGAGTGLGQGYLVWDAGRWRVLGSEGGHTAFAARDALEWGLAESLLAEYPHVSWERVLSGPGLAHVYRYLATRGVAPEQDAVREEMSREDPAAVVTRRALEGSDALCSKALDLWVSVYGAQAGHLALTMLATGGVYVAGGIAPRIVPKLREGTFMTAFRDQGRMADFACRVPVHVIVNPDVGLLGAAAVAAQP
jgi:glucokinase